MKNFKIVNRTSTLFLLLLLNIMSYSNIQAQIAYIPSSNNENTAFLKVVDLETSTIINSITVGKKPAAIAINSDESKIYTANRYVGTISVIETATNTVIETIDIGSELHGICLSPDESFLYVILINDNLLKIIDLSSSEIIATIATGSIPANVAASPDGKKVYYSNHYGESIGVLETTTNSVETNININRVGPSDVLVSPDNLKVYVTTVDGYLVTIDATSNSVSSEITTATTDTTDVVYSGLTLHPDGSKLYFYDIISQEVYLYDVFTEEIIGTIEIGADISGIDISPDGSKIVLLSHENNTIIVINAETYEMEETIVGFIEPYAFGSFIISSVDMTSSTENFSNLSNVLTVFPNPTADVINASINQTSTPAVSFTLYNSIGKRLKTGEINRLNSSLSIDVSSLAQGTYMLSVKGEDWITYEKIVLLK